MFRNKKINGILFLLVIMVIVIVTMHVFQMDRSEISSYVDRRIAEEGKLFLQSLTELKNEHLKVTANLKDKIELLERENNDRKTELESMHNKLQLLRAERLEVENRAKLLRPESLDIDMLDEKARNILGIIAHNEQVFKREVINNKKSD